MPSDYSLLAGISWRFRPFVLLFQANLAAAAEARRMNLNRVKISVSPVFAWDGSKDFWTFSLCVGLNSYLFFH